MLPRHPGDDAGDGRARGQPLEFGVTGSKRRYGRLLRQLVELPGLPHAAVGEGHRAHSLRVVSRLRQAVHVVTVTLIGGDGSGGR